MPKKEQSQIKAVLKHLQSKGHITSMEAIELYGATRLSGIIYTLREHGYNIITQKLDGVNRYGNKMKYAKYLYIPN